MDDVTLSVTMLFSLMVVSSVHNLNFVLDKVTVLLSLSKYVASLLGQMTC